MRGVGWASAAISFVNALPTGVGAAAAVTLPARVEVELTPGPKLAPNPPPLEILEGVASPLVNEAFRMGLEKFARGSSWSGRLRISSQVPMACGLKSSSAVSVAILSSIAHATGRDVDDVEIARLSADLSQGLGMSATGAFDDALACAAGGLTVTDNRGRRVVQHAEVTGALAVLIWVPPGAHASSPTWRDAFERRASEGQAAVDSLLAGDVFGAMERNTILVESVMGYSYSSLRRRLKEAGAVGVGVSGMGPALAAIFPPERLDAGSREFGTTSGRLVVTRFRTHHEPVGAAA